MKVICAGLPKTGTKSLAAALRLLDYNVYDFPEQASYCMKEFIEALNVGISEEDWREVLKGVDAVTDAPACFIWDEIYRANPDAKVILMTRDEDPWCKSFIKQLEIGRVNILIQILCKICPTGVLLGNLAEAFLRVGMGMKRYSGKPIYNENVIKMKARQHNAHCIATVPKDKLLIYNISEGWEPLCKFLGKPVPSTEFPHRNKGGVIIDEMVDSAPVFQQMKKEMIYALAITGVFASVFVYFAFLYFFS